MAIRVKQKVMAGNTINVQGNYIDIHDNEVVNIALSERGANLFATPSQSNVIENNLNIDKGTVTVNGEQIDTKEKSAVLTENGEFMAIMERAVEAGFCRKEGWQFQWEEKIDAVYFASVASHKFNLSRRHDSSGDLAISWKPFEALFNEKGFRSKYNDYLQGKIKVYHKTEIDKLLR